MMLLDATIRSSALLLLALAGCVVWRRHSAAWRHWILSVGVAAALAAMPLSLVLPAWTVAIPGGPATDRSAARDRLTTPATQASVTSAFGAAAASPPTPAHRSLPTASLLLAAWGVGVMIGAASLLAGAARLRRLTRRAERVQGGGWGRLLDTALANRRVPQVALFITESRTLLATWGIRRPHILLPCDAHSWTDARRRMVLAHELAHIRRGDWLAQMAADVLRTLFWFNPLAWIASARVRRESEHACDDEVLAEGVPAHEYADHLLDIARTRRIPPAWGSAMSMARPSTLERRISAMLTHSCDRRRPSRPARLSAVLALFTLALPVATIHLLAQGGPSALTVQVFDPTGAVLPGATLALEDAQGATRQAVTEGSGTIQFDAVSAGDYTLEASLVGFRTLRTPFTLAAASDWRRAVTLQVGDLQETVSVEARRPSLPPAERAGGVVEPLRVGGNIRVPKKLNHVTPDYPQGMRDAGLEGVVPMEALIGRDGTVSSVRLLSAQVHPDFARAAEEAVRQWRFSPTLLNGEAVEVRMTVSVRFSLTD
jgi:TonB family protein